MLQILCCCKTKLYLINFILHLGRGFSLCGVCLMSVFCVSLHNEAAGLTEPRNRDNGRFADFQAFHLWR